MRKSRLAHLEGPILEGVHLLGQLHVVIDARGGEDHALVSTGVDGVLAVVGLDADDAPLGVAHEVGCLGFGEDGHLVAVGEQLLLDGREVHAVVTVALAEEAAGIKLLAPLVDAPDGLEILDGVIFAAATNHEVELVGAVHADVAHHVLVDQALAPPDDVLGELLAGVAADARELLLQRVAGGLDGAAAHVGVAATDAGLLDHEHGATGLGRFDACTETGTAAAHYDEVGLVVPGDLLRLIGLADPGQGGEGRDACNSPRCGDEGAAIEGLLHGQNLPLELFGRGLYGTRIITRNRR